MIVSVINDKIDKRKSKERFSFSRFSFIDYHESNLLLIAREIMRLLLTLSKL